jgi:hypothetical protein
MRGGSSRTVPYITGSTQTKSYSACSSATSSTTAYRNWDEDEWVTYIFTAILKEEEIPVLEKKKPHFDRVMKLRNTDGRLFKPMVWKPIRG